MSNTVGYQVIPNERIHTSVITHTIRREGDIQTQEHCWEITIVDERDFCARKDAYFRTSAKTSVACRAFFVGIILTIVAVGVYSSIPRKETLGVLIAAVSLTALTCIYGCVGNEIDIDVRNQLKDWAGQNPQSIQGQQFLAKMREEDRKHREEQAKSEEETRGFPNFPGN